MTTSTPSAQAVASALERICGSPGFERSPRLRRLLRYLVEESRAGRSEALKEYAIGVEVFDRGAGFDPRLDPIVRVEARRLRARLAAYYGEAGAGDAVRIEVPTGAYQAIVSEAQTPARSGGTAAAAPRAGAADPDPEPGPVAPPVPAQGSLPVPAPTSAPSAAGGRARPLAWIAVAAVVLAASAALWRLAVPGEPKQGTPVAQASIAVLPLAPIGDDPQLAAFCDGLTEDIITQLARLGGVRVIARTSVDRYKETRPPIRQIANELGVATVLEGSVRREGGRVRVTAQLVDASDEGHRWAQAYDRSPADVLEVQGEVAREVARALALQLGPEQERRLLAPATASAAAYEAYLRGVHHLALRTPVEVRKAVALFEEALRLDPGYGAAGAALGETYLFTALEGAGPPAQLLDRTRALAQAALAAQPELAEGHRALGLVHAFRDRDWPAAERQLLEALELGPGMCPNHEALATAYLLPLGRIEQALARQREARACSPLGVAAIATLGRLSDLAGDEAEGIRLLESALELEPRYARAAIQLGKLHLSRGRVVPALQLLRQAAERAPGATSGTGALAVAYAEAGQREEAESIEMRLSAQAAVAYVPALTRAEVALALGQTDAAFHWLGQAVEAREPLVVYLGVDPLYAPLRDDPRFAALLRRLGLPQRR